MGCTTTTPLVHKLMVFRDDRRLLNLQRKLAFLKLLIIDELGFVPLSATRRTAFRGLQPALRTGLRLLAKDSKTKEITQPSRAKGDFVFFILCPRCLSCLPSAGTLLVGEKRRFTAL